MNGGGMGGGGGRGGCRWVTEVGGRRDDRHHGAGVGFDVSVGVGIGVIVHGGNGGRWWLVGLGQAEGECYSSTANIIHAAF